MDGNLVTWEIGKTAETDRAYKNYKWFGFVFILLTLSIISLRKEMLNRLSTSEGYLFQAVLVLLLVSFGMFIFTHFVRHSGDQKLKYSVSNSGISTNYANGNSTTLLWQDLSAYCFKETLEGLVCRLFLKSKVFLDIPHEVRLPITPDVQLSLERVLKDHGLTNALDPKTPLVAQDIRPTFFIFIIIFTLFGLFVIWKLVQLQNQYIGIAP